MNDDEILEAFIIEHSMRMDVKTLVSYEYAIQSLRTYCSKPIREIVRSDIVGWMGSDLDRGIAASTVRVKRAASRTFFRYCLDEGHIDKDPTKSTKPPKLPKLLPKYLDQSTVFAIKDAAKDDLRNMTIIEVLHKSGIRVSELINIRLTDVKEKQRQIWIEFGKRDQQRNVVVTPECIARIIDYKNKRSDDCPYLFVSKQGKQLTRQFIRQMISNYAKTAGVGRVTPHSFRHTFARELAEAKVPPEIIAKLLGHTKLRMVRRYTGTFFIKYDTFLILMM